MVRKGIDDFRGRLAREEKGLAMTQPIPTERQTINMVIMGLTVCMSGRALKMQEWDQSGKDEADVEVALLREKILCLARALVIILEE